MLYLQLEMPTTMISTQNIKMKPPRVSIALINPKSVTNVGAVMRAAGCYQVDAVFYSGSRYDRAAKMQTDTKDIQQKIPLSGVDDLLASVPENAKVICIELALGAIPLPDYQHPDNAVYVFGPEDGTISQSIIDRADAVVYVPTAGCMNLAASVNVVLYDRLVKSAQYHASDALILQSRDTNNTVKWRPGKPDRVV